MVTVLGADMLTVLSDWTIPQVEITSCGLNGGPLPGKGGIKEIRIKVRGYADGVFEVRTAWDGEVLA